MAEFLSQDEIDALLDIAEQGEDIETPIERVISKEKNYSIYSQFNTCFSCYNMNELKYFYGVIRSSSQLR
jgi:hypothetical protein